MILRPILLRTAAMLIVFFGVSLNAYSQEIQVGWIVPDFSKLSLPKSNMAYLPEGGLNLYDKPGGEIIARLNRDPRTRNYANYLLNIFLLPRNRAPELLPTDALVPLPENCFAVPFARKMNSYVLLFDTLGPYQYWAAIRDIEKHDFLLTNKLKNEWESNETSNTENAAGVLIPDFDTLKDLPREQFAYLPEQGLILYDAPHGNPTAKLSRFCPVGKFTDGHMRMFVLPDSNPNNCGFVTQDQLHHLSDDTYTIPFYKNVNGFVLLFNQQTLGSTWAKHDEIVSKNFKLVGWKDYFIERRTSPAYANDPGLNLREGPYSDARKLFTVKGETMEIFIVGYEENLFCEGQWCKVSVKVYHESPCKTSVPEEKNLLRIYDGWIKLIDDNGQPNIYMNTKGC